MSLDEIYILEFKSYLYLFLAVFITQRLEDLSKWMKQMLRKKHDNCRRQTSCLHKRLAWDSNQGLLDWNCNTANYLAGQFWNVSFGIAEEMLKWRVWITKILQAKKIYINKNSLCQCAIYFDKSMSLSIFFYPITSKLTT